MWRLMAVLSLVAALFPVLSSARGQDRTRELNQLRRENELLKREIDVLKREVEQLKRELGENKKGGPAGQPAEEPAGGTRVTVSRVDYVYQGAVRNGTSLIVTIVATSQKGDLQGPNGSMTLVDDEGDKYVGIPAGGFGLRPTLREGVPTKLTWRFGPNPITGKSSAPSPRLTRFAAIIIEPTVGGGDEIVEFRNVPVTVAKPKPR